MKIRLAENQKLKFFLHMISGVLLLPEEPLEIQELYQNTKEGNRQRWLMIDVHSDENEN